MICLNGGGGQRSPCIACGHGAAGAALAKRRPAATGRTGMTFVARDEALAMLDGLELEMFEEEEDDGVTPRGNAKHWHIFHIVASKSADR